MTDQAPELLPLADWLDEQIAQAASQQAQSYSMASEYGQRQGERWHARQIALYETKLKLAALTRPPSERPVAQSERAATIEECAKVCDSHAEWAADKIRDDGSPEGTVDLLFATIGNTANDCAEMIRALAAQAKGVPAS